MHCSQETDFILYFIFTEDWTMSKIDNSYSSAYYNSVQQTQQNSRNAKMVDTSKQTDKTKQPKLSKKAQALLEKLKKTYGNMDFMVADFDNEDDAKEILSRGTKEFSVLFSSEELEKMASDEKYEKEYMDRVNGAVRMSEQINQEFGFKSVFGNASNKGDITKIGISFNKDGTMSYFAELEKSTNQQKDYIDKIVENRAEEKKTATKKTTVKASSMDELIKKMNEIDWSKIKEEKKSEGDKFDFSI